MSECNVSDGVSNRGLTKQEEETTLLTDIRRLERCFPRDKVCQVLGEVRSNEENAVDNHRGVGDIEESEEGISFHDQVHHPSESQGIENGDSEG